MLLLHQYVSSVIQEWYTLHCRYAVQYEDGDKEEFTPSQLKKKGVLQPEGEGDRTDFEELDRLYAVAKAEWAAGNFLPPPP